MAILIISASWVLLCSVWNVFEPRVPNWLTSLGFILAIVFRWNNWLLTGVINTQIMTILITWGTVLLLWKIRWLGGGDAKFTATLVLAFPDLVMIAYMMIADITGLVIYSIKRDGIRWKKMKPKFTGNLEQFPEKKDRLRATTFIGIGWLFWATVTLHL